MAVTKFVDNSSEVKAAINQTTIEWLYEWANEIASHAKDNCQLEDDAGAQLRGSYRAEVDEGAGQAQIGSSLEAAYWEEFGTGSYADTSKNGGRQGRSDWWVYYRNSGPNPDTPHYDETTAKSVAESLRQAGRDALASNGRRPNYTLEKAFTANKDKAIADLEKKLGRKLDG